MKYEANNQYPAIILSDTTVSNIEYSKKCINISFDEYGFCIKNEDIGKYLRPYKSQLIVEGCDEDEISIELIKNCNLLRIISFNIVTEIKYKNFFKNINSKKWSFEIVEEFYSCHTAYYTGQLTMKKRRFWCNVKFNFKNLTYKWDDINYDAVVD